MATDDHFQLNQADIPNGYPWKTPASFSSTNYPAELNRNNYRCKSQTFHFRTDEPLPVHDLKFHPYFLLNFRVTNIPAPKIRESYQLLFPQTLREPQFFRWLLFGVHSNFRLHAKTYPAHNWHSISEKKHRHLFQFSRRCWYSHLPNYPNFLSVFLSQNFLKGIFQLLPEPIYCCFQKSYFVSFPEKIKKSRQKTGIIYFIKILFFYATTLAYSTVKT